MNKYLKKKYEFKYLKFLVELKVYNYFKNVVEEKKSQEFRF